MTGPASPEHAPFRAAARAGRFVIPTCRTCGKAHWYPRGRCPFCFGGDPRLVFCYLPLFAFGFAAFLFWERRLHWLEIALWTAAFAAACSRTLGPDDIVSGLLAAGLILAPWPRNGPRWPNPSGNPEDRLDR